MSINLVQLVLACATLRNTNYIQYFFNLRNNILNGDGAVPMFTFFLAFANLGAHVSSTIIPVLPSWESSYCIDEWISTSIFLPVSTILCLLDLYGLHAQFVWWKVGYSLDLVGENSLSFWWGEREMGYKETLRERSQCLDKVTKGWSAEYWTKKQSRPSALPWISNSLQCSRPSYLTEDRRVLKKIP